jgi:hypothetical protein
MLLYQCRFDAGGGTPGDGADGGMGEPLGSLGNLTSLFSCTKDGSLLRSSIMETGFTEVVLSSLAMADEEINIIKIAIAMRKSRFLREAGTAILFSFTYLR